jgi:hypothetical protein
MPNPTDPSAPDPIKEANRCIVSSLDCREAVEYLDALVELQEMDEEAGNSKFFTHRQGLMVAAIVSYSRAFSKSYGGGKSTSKFELDIDVAVGKDPKLRALHDLIIERRDKVAAHSDWEYRQSEQVKMEGVAGILRKNSVVNYQDEIDTDIFRNLAKVMEEHFRFAGFDRDINQKKNRDGAI